MTLCEQKEFLSLTEKGKGARVLPIPGAPEEPDQHSASSAPLEKDFLPGRDLLSSYPLAFPRHALEKEKSIHLIKPTYSSRGISNIEFDAYVTFIEQMLRNVLPQDLLIALSASRNPNAIKDSIQSLNETLPFLAWNTPDRAPCTLSVSLLCHSDLTSGVGRYLCDILARWLIPGKFINICSVRSLNFSFISYPQQPLYFHQVLLDVENDQQLNIIKNNRENLSKEIRLSIMAVRHARHVVSVKKLSSEQKKAIIEENIASVISPPLKTQGHSLFDQMHSFWVHLSAEDKIKQIQEQFSPYLENRPKIFDGSIFQEIKHSILLFGDKFTGMRDLRHLSRLISYQYLFRKTLMREIMEAPEERHLSIKVLRTQISSSGSELGGARVLGILGAMNVLRENELFEERHIEEAMTHCIPYVRKVENSFVLDRRSHDPIRLFYIEIEKMDGSTFSLDEIKELKKNLPHELKENVESVLHPVLMPRNEEEIMRNIFLLSQQLKYINDLPQVIISFNAQTEHSLQFTVILLRILRDEDLSLPQIFAASGTELKIEELEVKKVGLLRKRYPKEANVFKISLDKKKFLRRDFTIDLFKARQELSLELSTVFKGIRDFNGGILSKQQEVFQALRGLIKETTAHNDFLLENFFYSITPPLRQTLIAPTSLQTLFSLMQEAFDADYKKENFFLKARFEPDQVLTMAASPLSSIKEELFSLLVKLKIPSSELSCTTVNAYGISCFGYIYQNRDPNIRNLFYSTLLSCLQEWQTRIKN
ncbi:MAG: hypothetical protein JSS60_06570 [Verrucomicrobia bacterium]|nr:hypothetical protein [Verrucomicrobiota bacterium]